MANIDQRLADIAAEQAELLAAAEAELDPSVLAQRLGEAIQANSDADTGFKLAY